MWVFCYGSLMWDSWEADYNCSTRSIATLSGHLRAFNKPSSVNWGTKACPCPTLNLIKDEASSCTGMAFCFPDAQEQAVRAFLVKREGKNFLLQSRQAVLEDGSNIEVYVSIYEKDDIMKLPVTELCAQIRNARGKKGSGIDYVKGIATRLLELNIVDPVVIELWNQVRPPPPFDPKEA